MRRVRTELFGRDGVLDAVDGLLGRLGEEGSREEGSLPGSGPESGAAERTVLLVGDPGVGKTVLLEAAAERFRSSGGQVRWVVGRAEESGLAFSGLDGLLHPWHSTRAGLAPEDRQILETALWGGKPGEGGPLARAGALLRVLSGWAGAGPLLVVVDDLQWVDRSTQDLLSVCARRMQGEPIGFLLASRPLGLPSDWTRQSSLHHLGCLDEVESARLLDSQPVPPQGRVRRQVLRQAAGNPLALVEFARSAAAGAPSERREELELPLTERLEHLFAADLAVLPAPTRRLLLLAAAADLPDLTAMARLLGDPGEPGSRGADGVAVPADEAWAVAEQAGLVTLRQGVIGFRHPLVRSAILAAAPLDRRLEAHRLIASLPGLDEDRRAWHRAAATVTADESAAAALEATADRARQRGGYTAGAATLERAAQLSPRSVDRVRRLNAAAELAIFAGHPRWVAELSAAAAAEADTPGARAAADLRAGWSLALTSRHDQAVERLLAAVDGWAASEPEEAVGALGTAVTPAYVSGDPRLRAKVLDRYRRLGEQPVSAASAWVLAGCDSFGARTEALAHLERAKNLPELSPGDLSMVGAAAWALDETEQALALYGRMLELFRRTPTAGANATVSSAHAIALFEAGRWSAALAGVGEAEHAAAAGGLELATVSTQILAAVLAAVRGDTGRARQTLTEATRDFDLPGTRVFEARVRQALALAALAEGDHRAAHHHLGRLFHRDGEPVHFHVAFHSLADLAANAVRVGRAEEARSVLDSAVERLPTSVSLRLHLILCRARGVLADGVPAAEESLREAAFDPGGERWPFERALALADLGEWLRRRQRAADARQPLTEALELFQGLGASPWATRTAAELRAAGVDTAPRRTEGAAMELTPQQLSIVELAADGLSNKEIAARLFLSPRTVGFHLNRAFPKLGVTSRFQLRDVVARRDPGQVI